LATRIQEEEGSQEGKSRRLNPWQVRKNHINPTAPPKHRGDKPDGQAPSKSIHKAELKLGPTAVIRRESAVTGTYWIQMMRRQDEQLEETK
jgi:hypothetical protein